MKSLYGITAIAVLLISGCATSYQSSNVMGGYSDVQLAPDVFRIIFRGNGYTSPERAQDFALLRASEVALQNDFNYFAIIEERNTTSAHAFSTPGTAQTSGTASVNGNSVTYSGQTTYTPGHTHIFYKPKTGLIFQGFKSKPDKVFTFDAAFLQQSLRQTYHIK